MPWFCNGCGERRYGTSCKKWCVEKYGPNIGAVRIPRLDGMMFINDDGSGVPRYEVMKKADMKPFRYEVKSIQGPRPNGWNTALDAIGERCIPLMVGELPEC